ncbi:Acyltransferase family protein [Grimontia celer]|uniref:Acyltransferase family protein n=1 Tax=Grimontia celer TaxID=1796497 RepID=A0A128EZR6_9GAMM|nr:acyltransferase [Grimontia celer]CZF80048.1 Acyltransferase family protein [Grimontia celer]
MFINSFNHFRAVAIIFIVMGHCYSITGMTFNTFPSAFIQNFISGGTTLFVFISGFLFYHIFYKNFNLKTFLIKKIKTVLLPYVIIGSLPVIYLTLKQASVYGDWFLPSGDSLLDNYLIPTLKYYSSGRFLTGYWYIPFIFIIFLMSPFFIQFIELRKRYQIIIIALMSVIAMYAHRPILNINPLHSAIYYIPVYLLGIFAAINRLKIYTWLMGKELILMVVIVSLITYQTMNGHNGSYHKYLFSYSGIDLVFIHKILLCFLLMIILHRFENFKHPLINHLAATSFTVFFLHPLAIFLMNKFLKDALHFDSWVFLSIFTTLIITICSLIAVQFKKLAPINSRYIIGY